MAKLNRFYLLVAALVYAKSYFISDAYAYTASQCSKLQTLLTRAIGVGSIANMDSQMPGIALQLDGGQEGEHYLLWDAEIAYLESCAYNKFSDIARCEYEEDMNWGCGGHKCSLMYGYNTSTGSCERCVAGEYRRTGDWGDWYGDSCRTCPTRTYAGSVPTSNITTADEATDCYIPSSQTWTATDTNGATYVTRYKSDCYYSGNAGDTGTAGS